MSAYLKGALTSHLPVERFIVLVSYSFNLFFLFGMEQLWGCFWGRGVVLGGGEAVMNTELTLGLFPGNLRPVHGMPIAAANMSDDIYS